MNGANIERHFFFSCERGEFFSGANVKWVRHERDFRPHNCIYRLWFPQQLGEQVESGNSSPHFSGENSVDGVDRDIDTVRISLMASMSSYPFPPTM